MSLYLWVNKYGHYSIGHPTFLYQLGTTDLSLYFGLAKCTLLSPDDLYHTVLPYSPQAKLTFPLCHTCVKDNLDPPLLDKATMYQHTDHQRTLTGRWCTHELEEAMRHSYNVVHVHEM